MLAAYTGHTVQILGIIVFFPKFTMVWSHYFAVLSLFLAAEVA